ncbi:MAG: hypothetical protein P8K72_01825 [Flavobacteriaceae bacterium]|nr:hypothetical protein [Flavobacteriaceae bacterium]
MLREQNIKNLKTEKDGIVILKSLLDTFIVPTKDQRKTLYEILNIDYKKYSRSVDGVVIHVDSFDKITNKRDFDLVEIKTTSSKSVKKLPYGVFFGFTKNEEDLFKKLDNYKLCIVHTKLKNYVMLDYNEYESLIQNKRIQYQVNFKSHKDS